MAPSVRLAVVGEIVCGVAPTRLTVAVLVPEAPIAVIVTVGLDGIVDGAV